MTWEKGPKVGTFEDFDKVEKHNKMFHPIQFFFRDTIPTRIKFFGWRLRDAKWWVLHRIHPKKRFHIVHSGLKPGYHDIPELMLYTTFSFLERYVEDEKCFETINWESFESHRCVHDELKDLYYWWKKVRPTYEDEIDALYDQIEIRGLGAIGNRTDNDKEVYDKINVLEIRNNATDIYQMKRLVSIKDFMWT